MVDSGTDTHVVDSNTDAHMVNSGTDIDAHMVSTETHMVAIVTFVVKVDTCMVNTAAEAVLASRYWVCQCISAPRSYIAGAYA